ncbi:MAG: hypothetical protein QNM02_20650 [Acidimicrobiia bacterium]|nr:hypothetical protein [Acidimicrobiia bacterium]
MIISTTHATTGSDSVPGTPYSSRIQHGAHIEVDPGQGTVRLL